MTAEQWLQLGGFVIAGIFGGGGIAALYGVHVTRKLGIKTGENEANRDLNQTWDAIVENLQNQINALSSELKDVKNGQNQMLIDLGNKERLLLKAILHIGRLELLLPAEKIPNRPEGLE